MSFLVKFLRMCKKSSTFAAILSRDGGIGRHEGLKILWPVMAVRVQVPLAVQSQKEVLNMKMLSTSFISWTPLKKQKFSGSRYYK